MSTGTRFRPSGWPDSSHSPSSSSTSASLSSSFSSDSAASEMHESLSDFTTQSDHSANTPLPAPIPRPARVHDLAVAAPRPRSSSLAAAMGQSYSKPTPSPPNVAAGLAQKSLALGTAAANTGLKIKRAFANRRKKSEDATKLFAGRDEKEWVGPTAIASSYSAPSSSSTPSVAPVEVFSGGKKQQNDSLPSPVPPTPPPKPASMQPVKPSSAPPSASAQTLLKADHRGSIIPISPGISSAVNFMISEEQERASQARAKELAETPEESQKEKEVWRKSDSTMSYHTIRPGAAVANRSSRPVSMAESMNSNHTVVPTKRLSQLLVDSELDTTEEDDSSFISASEEFTPAPISASSLKNRRSMSLSLGPVNPKVNVPPAPASSTGSITDMSRSHKPDGHHILTPSTSASETPTLTRAAANGLISPSNNGTQSTGTNIRGRLAALTSANHSAGSQPRDRNRAPPSSYNRSTPSPQPQSHSRPAAISLTGGFGPAAGLAKRAVEKMGRAWGGFSSSSSGSVYSSSSSSTGHSSDHALGRTNSNTSNDAPRAGKGKSRRTPDAPSGSSWSMASSSDSDGFMPTPAGPSLGKRIRGPMRVMKGGETITSGVVFGRELFVVVKETAVGVGVNDLSLLEDRDFEQHDGEGNVDPAILKALEERALPAVIVRCAQHLLVWGVHEEGLFRVSGRPSHVTKLRHEFDTGADFDIKHSSPGDLDPHAVASIFKAFLRELPEPILTHSLIPYFEAALSQENETNSREQPTQPRAARGPTLPSNPKSGIQGLRKPPSLSTLAMPNFSGMRPPSRSLRNALKSLISQLPRENRDLIRTVTELIKATANESRQTKMPLSNLLLVFCPSLNMNPPLLRVLCEAEEIWEGPPLESPVLDIKRESIVLDISPTTSVDKQAGKNVVEHPKEDEEVKVNDAHVAQDVSSDRAMSVSPSASPRPSMSTSSGRPSAEHPRTGDRNAPRTRPMGPRRAHTPAISVDNDTASGISADSGASSSMVRSSSETASVQDDVASYTSTSASESQTSPSSGGFLASSPPFTSSVESLATPSSSLIGPSLEDLKKYSDLEGRHSVIELGDEDPLTPRNLADNVGSIQFPTTGSTPPTPVSPRRFVPALSLPVISSSNVHASPTNSAPASPRRPRVKKPSLQLLFSKRSASPLSSSAGGMPYISSPYLQAPRAASDSSVSTPSTTMTAPQSSTFTLPPVLDTPIESSPLHFGLGFDAESPEPSPTVEETGDNSNNSTTKDAQSSSPPRASTPAPGETPIANLYRPSASTLSLPLTSSSSASPSPPPSHLRTRPTLRSRQVSKSSMASTSSNHLGLLDDEDREDWTQSVLLAADAEGNWNFPNGGH